MPDSNGGTVMQPGEVSRSLSRIERGIERLETSVDQKVTDVIKQISDVRHRVVNLEQRDILGEHFHQDYQETKQRVSALETKTAEQTAVSTYKKWLFGFAITLAMLIVAVVTLAVSN